MAFFDSSSASPDFQPEAGVQPSAADDGPSGYGARRRQKPARDTVILHSDDFYDSLHIKTIPPAEFAELTKLILDNFGISIGENKLTLLTGRIHPVMENHGFATHREYLNAIKTDKTGELLSELANRVSTNHTAFYREDAHFSLLTEKILPLLTRKKTAEGSRDIRIWSAACATGEEPYTILFTLLKYFHYDYQNWRAGVLATDISAAALDTAKRGLYNAQKVSTVPKDVLKLFFNELDEDAFEVKEECRKEVTFRRLNLISDLYPFRQKFDVIFCRNVMIYFNRETREQLLDRLRDWLVPGGYLFVGHSESLVNSHPGFETVAPAVYVKTIR